jgi:DNA-binding response OmpR family regulator
VPTVLIVDDEPDVRRIFRIALSLAGYRVQEAGDVLSAVRLLDISPPNLVILDLGLPFISGHAIRQEIAAHAHTRDIPIIIVTGSSMEAPPAVACVLRKPVSPDELVAAVKHSLTSRVPPLES